jgi:4-hydroxy-tetrahydrodipicolinate reductase
MNIALLGYGRMGHEVETVAIERGHIVKIKIDIDNHEDLNPKCFREIDTVWR